MLDPRSSSPSEFIASAKQFGVPERASRSLLAKVVGHGSYDPSEWVSSRLLSKAMAAQCSPLRALTLKTVQTSSIDGFQKLLFETADGLPLETVLIPLHKQGAVSLCISSQVGCVMGCAFCATAKMKSRRNLQTWEIVDQFVQARQFVRAQGRTVTGVVFMGMGEPFLNYKNVIAAASVFCFPIQGAVAAKSITVSTVGLLPEIERFTVTKQPYRLSISIGAAIDEKRQLLVPVAARTPIESLAAAARRYTEESGRRVNIAYVCVDGVNVGLEDARALGRLFSDFPIRLDLIDVCDSSGRFLPPSDDQLGSFRDALAIHLPQPVARRYSGGKDIQAACGTLAGGIS